MGLRCQCGRRKNNPWHITCRTCWAALPQELRDAVYNIEDAGSFREIRRCVRNVLRYLRNHREAVASKTKPF